MKVNKYIIELSSKKISQEWWGQQWCQNIELYADFNNRLGRGRTYLRKQYIQDLTINESKITANVIGTRPEPYTVTINIDPLAETTYLQALSQINTINLIKKGIVPENCKELFSIDKGLFPLKNEIHFQCSCPDNAKMCKHIAAVLYAIGSILDQEPLILFQLRGIDVDKYLDAMLIEKTNDLLLNFNNNEPNEKIIDDSSIFDIFGIELATSSLNTDFTPTTSNISTTQSQVPTMKIVKIKPGNLSNKNRSNIKTIKKDRIIIRQFRLDGVYINQYESYAIAEKITSVKIDNIQKACSGYRKTAGGYQWKKVKADEPIKDIAPVTNINKTEVQPVLQFTIDGILIKKFSSISEASRITAINTKSIRDTVKGRQKTAGNFQWRYEYFSDITINNGEYRLPPIQDSQQSNSFNHNETKHTAVKLLFLIGCSCSGKSTFAESKSKEKYTVFSSDETRLALGFKEYDLWQNNAVFKKLHKDIIDSLLNGNNSIFDATNLNKKQRGTDIRRFRRQCDNVKIIGIVFLEPLDELIARSQKRTKTNINNIPNSVLRKQYEQLKSDFPSMDEDFDELIFMGKI